MSEKKPWTMPEVFSAHAFEVVRELRAEIEKLKVERNGWRASYESMRVDHGKMTGLALDATQSRLSALVDLRERAAKATEECSPSTLNNLPWTACQLAVAEEIRALPLEESPPSTQAENVSTKSDSVDTLLVAFPKVDPAADARIEGLMARQPIHAREKEPVPRTLRVTAEWEIYEDSDANLSVRDARTREFLYDVMGDYPEPARSRARTLVELRAAAERALEALKNLEGFECIDGPPLNRMYAAIAALEKALGEK